MAKNFLPVRCLVPTTKNPDKPRSIVAVVARDVHPQNGGVSTVTAGHHNAHLSRGVREVHAVGSYLKAVCAGERRLHRYAAGLLAISAHM